MKTYEMTFLEKTKRYLAPIFGAPAISLKSFTIYSIWGINMIIHIVFIQSLVGILENGVRDAFIHMLTYYVIYCIIYEILDYSMRKWGWVENINAHRLQTVKHADDIIYISDGKITERGNHSELIQKEGLYKHMLDLQSGF